jgi:probable HAF family extracellular repeat protein
MKRQTIFVLAIISIFVDQSFGDLPHGQIIDLGTLGGDYSTAYAVNDVNQVVGVSSKAGGDHAPFLWKDLNHNGHSDPCEMQDLGNLGGTHGSAYAINNNGEVVGDSEITSHGRPHAFLWKKGVMLDLGTFGGFYSKAFGINDSNQVVGIFDTSPCCHVFLWEDDVMTDLNICGDWVGGINNSGQVAGYGFLWEDGVVTDLSNLQGKAINETGQVTGFFYNYSGWRRAFFWKGGTTTNLGTLGGRESLAYGINDSNQVVGTSENAINDNRAFLWSGGVMIDLNSLLPEGSGWELMEARDINNHGCIVGFGFINGEQHAFLLKLLGLDTVCIQTIPGDINRDCKVDFTDLAILASNWLDCNLMSHSACWE